MPSEPNDSPLLRQFERLVEEMERGQHPPRCLDRAVAVNALVDEIRVAPWQSAEARERAQGLVARLERLLGGPAGPVPAPGAGCSPQTPPPALTADVLKQRRSKGGRRPQPGQE